jgi:hypothetical protein
MNLKEINRLIASLIFEDETANQELIQFYRRKREELLIMIDDEIVKKMEELQCDQ